MTTKTVDQQDEFYRQLGAVIRRCRKKRNLSQEELAKAIGLTRTSLTNIESGRQHPPLHTFCEIAEQLQVEFSELLPRFVPAVQVDVEELAGAHLRSDHEMAFIKTAIGIKRTS